MGLLDGELAELALDAGSEFFLDATLTRDVQGTIVDPADPPAPTQVTTYACLAIEQEYSVGLRGRGLVDATDIQILILANSLAVQPEPLDRIAILAHGVRGTIVPASTSGEKAVQSDPAKATWLCRCRS